MKRLLALLLSVMSSAALAQTTATVNPNPVPVQPSATDEVPPGGCMPIGMTASGDIVFPIQCKAFIERHRGAPVELKPATLEDKPAVKQLEGKELEAKHLEAKHLDGKHLEEPAPETGKPATKPAEAVSSPKRAELTGRERANNLGNCTHYRTYNPASGTYRSYDGRVSPC